MYRLFLLMPLFFAFTSLSFAQQSGDTVTNAQRLVNEGLHQDAYNLLRPWLLNAGNGDHLQYERGLTLAVQALQRLNRVPETDELLESAATAQKGSWRAMREIAQQYVRLPSNGVIIDNQFQRGPSRGGGQWVQTRERDRVRALQLMHEVMPLALKEEKKDTVAPFLISFADMLMRAGWQMQILTDISELPEYNEGFFGGGSSMAPVDAEGNPVYYYVPESWETAQNDGERWRWVLDQAAKREPGYQEGVWRRQADFYRSQFGEQTLRGINFFQRTDQDPERTASILTLETLSDDETIARLATGIKRFTLPEEFNYIALYKKIDDWQALQALAQIAQNRRQYPKAAEYFATLIEHHGDENQKNQWRRQRDQIVKKWGRFEVAGSEIAGLNADLRYVFRNGNKVKLTVQEINTERFIADVKEYLKSRPYPPSRRSTDIYGIGHELFYGGNYGSGSDYVNEARKREANEKYLGEIIKTWEMPLKPAENHFDRSTIVSFNSETAGAFLIRAEMEDGNVESAVIWLEDTTIVRKRLDNSFLYFVADAQTGTPIPDATVDVFGFKTERQGGQDIWTWTFQESTHKTDNGGFVIVQADRDEYRFRTLVTAKVPGKQGIAYLDFESMWVSSRYDADYNETKTFVITDRPVYRPLDTVNIKAWVGTAQYDKSNNNEWAERSFKYEIYDPRGEKLVEKEVVLDGYGGMTAELELPKDAALGVYSFIVTRGNINGHGTFRVEEYKKPEYEVTVEAPKEPVSLGDTITAKINAKYYFGSPVAEATVKYKVMRETATTDWFPIMPWDWFYGNGYGWFAYDSEWLPGWVRWGIRRPSPPWFSRFGGPPEMVAEVETQINPDGTVDVVIDTSIAKELFPNDNQRYTIMAEVIDNSRRTIVGTGTVLVAKEPFKVYSWVNRGFYTPGQKVVASFQTRRLDGKPVPGEAAVKVFRLTYGKNNVPSPPEGERVRVRGEEPAEEQALTLALSQRERGHNFSVTETLVHEANVTFDATGKANLDLTAAAPGQYRIACVLDGQEGGYVFNVYAPKEPQVERYSAQLAGGNNVTAENPEVALRYTSGSLGSPWRYNALELIPERSEYAPGENVTLRINTDRENSTVLLFVKPTNGVMAGQPQVLKLEGKSTEVSIPVVQRDMPNFFVEALTVTDGKIVNEVREIVVPPQERVLNVEVKPNSDTYKPGGKATADLIVTDLEGKPVIGQIAVTIYDKSVEYIGGQNVGDIKEFFWKWRRSHQPQTTSNLNRWWGSFGDPEQPRMSMLGILGFETPAGAWAFAANGMVPQARMRGMGDGINPGVPELSADMAMPMSAPMPMSPGQAPAMEIAEEVAVVALSMADFDPGGGLVDPTIRSNFADTALWIGALETNSDGIAQIELEMPESLTTWKINVWTMALGTRVGHGSTEVITRKDLIVRMQTPRFLIEKDKVVFSANVHNYLANEKEVSVSLEIGARAGGASPPVASEEISVPQTGGLAPPAPEGDINIIDEATRTQIIKIPANGEARIDWLVEALAAGDAVIVMKALTDEESDAVEKTLPVYVHGMLKQDSFSAFIAPDKESTTIEIRVPEERKPEQTKLTVNFSPSLAASMIDALPYLVDYPYGCTEQTLNKFLPTVIVRKIIGDGWDISQRAGGASPPVASEHAPNRGVSTPRSWAIARKVSPVFDKEQIDEMVRDGVTRLTNMQCSDGGWGWFSGWGERSSGHLTALVLHGLFMARECDVDVPDDVLERGMNWLRQYQNRQIVRIKYPTQPEGKERADEVDAFVFMVLAQHSGMTALDGPTADMLEFLQRDRGKLSLYAVGMVGIAESHLPGERDLSPYIRILEQYLVQDESNQTAYLNLRGFAGWRWWNWYGSEFETQAYYLKLLMRADPKSPIAPGLVKYLLANRKHATYWNSTRDTAIVIEAFAEYMRATGEGKVHVTVEVLFDGVVKKTVEFTQDNFLVTDGTLVLGPDEISSGTHKVELRKKGENPLYITAYLENFTLEDPIEKAGLEVTVERRIYKLVRDESATTAVAGGRGQVVDMRVEKYNRVPLTPNPLPDDGVRVGAIRPLIQSGDLIEVELIIESKNDYEYLIIEDWKAAGSEPVDLRSGYNGNELGAYVEFRDERVVFFVNRLARGKHSVTYRLRAETPGEFSALPARIEAMYAPELKGNSDEDKMKIVDR